MSGPCGVCVLALGPGAAWAQTSDTTTYPLPAPAPTTTYPLPTPPPPEPTVADLDTWPYGIGQFGVMLGSDTDWAGGPASFRLTVQSGYDFVGNEKFAVGGDFPVTLVTQGEESFGISTNHTALEFPPSFRFRVSPMSVVRIYIEVGIGLVWVVSNETDGWYIKEDSDLGFMSRGAIGLEIGKPRGFMFLLEPVSTRTYWMEETYGRLGIMAGGGLRM
jgi:hypothetical protein